MISKVCAWCGEPFQSRLNRTRYCTRVCGNRGQTISKDPAVVFPSTTYRAGYELHGTHARDYYAARDKARAQLEALKVKLRGEGLKAQRGDEPR